MPAKVTNGSITRLQTRLARQGLKINVVDRLERTYMINLRSLEKSNFGERLGFYLIRQARFEVGNIFWDMRAKETIINSLREVKDPDSIKLLQRIGKLPEVEIYYSVETKELVFLAIHDNIYEAQTQEVLDSDPDGGKSPPFCSTAGLEREKQER